MHILFRKQTRRRSMISQSCSKGSRMIHLHKDKNKDQKGFVKKRNLENPVVTGFSRLTSWCERRDLTRGANCAPWSAAVTTVHRTVALYRGSFKSLVLFRQRNKHPKENPFRCCFLVRETGLEPVRVTPHAPQTCASAYSATLAIAPILYHLRFEMSSLFAEKLNCFFDFSRSFSKRVRCCRSRGNQN